MKNRRTDPLKKYTQATITPKYDLNDRDECASIKFQIKLENIKAAFDEVEIGEILEVRIERVNVLTVYNSDGAECGNIASSFNGTIIQCKKKGKEFGVEVLNKSGLVLVFSVSE